MKKFPKAVSARMFNFRIILEELLNNKGKTLRVDYKRTTMEDISEIFDMFGQYVSVDQIRRWCDKQEPRWPKYANEIAHVTVQNSNVKYEGKGIENFAAELNDKFLFLNRQQQSLIFGNLWQKVQLNLEENFSEEYLKKFNSSTEGSFKIYDQLKNLRGSERVKKNRDFLIAILNSFPNLSIAFKLSKLDKMSDGSFRVATLGGGELPAGRTDISSYAIQAKFENITERTNYQDSLLVSKWEYTNEIYDASKLTYKKIQKFGLLLYSAFQLLDQISLKKICLMNAKELELSNPIFSFVIWLNLQKFGDNVTEKVFSKPRLILNYIQSDEELMGPLNINVDSLEVIEMQFIDIFIKFLDFRSSDYSFLPKYLKRSILYANNIESVLKDINIKILKENTESIKYGCIKASKEIGIINGNKKIEYLTLRNVYNSELGDNLLNIKELFETVIYNKIEQIDSDIKIFYSLEEMISDYINIVPGEKVPRYFVIELHSIVTSDMANIIVKKWILQK